MCSLFFAEPINTHHANLSQLDGRMITLQGTSIHETHGTDHLAMIGTVCAFPDLEGSDASEEYYSSHIHCIHSPNNIVPMNRLAQEISHANKRNNNMNTHNSNIITDGAEGDAGFTTAISYPTPMQCI